MASRLVRLYLFSDLQDGLQRQTSPFQVILIQFAGAVQRLNARSSERVKSADERHTDVTPRSCFLYRTGCQAEKNYQTEFQTTSNLSMQTNF